MSTLCTRRWQLFHWLILQWGVKEKFLNIFSSLHKSYTQQKVGFLATIFFHLVNKKKNFILWESQTGTFNQIVNTVKMFWTVWFNFSSGTVHLPYIGLAQILIIYFRILVRAQRLFIKALLESGFISGRNLKGIRLSSFPVAPFSSPSQNPIHLCVSYTNWTIRTNRSLKRPHYFWHQLQGQRGPQATVRFDNLWEVLTELTESYCTCGYGLLWGKD